MTSNNNGTASAVPVIIDTNKLGIDIYDIIFEGLEDDKSVDDITDKIMERIAQEIRKGGET